MTTEVKKPKVKLTGTDGNVFALLGACSKALNKVGQAEQARLMFQEATKADSYHAALAVMMKYCDVR